VPLTHFFIDKKSNSVLKKINLDLTRIKHMLSDVMIQIPHEKVANIPSLLYFITQRKTTLNRKKDSGVSQSKRRVQRII
jgi:hypothetical protein